MPDRRDRDDRRRSRQPVDIDEARRRQNRISPQYQSRDTDWEREEEEQQDRGRNVARMPDRASRSAEEFGGRRRGGMNKTIPLTRKKASNSTVFWRTSILAVICGILMFIPLIHRLYVVAIVHHEDYSQMAAQQQTMDLSLSADRGRIYDTNGSIMAMSATVYDLILSPRDLAESVDEAPYIDQESKKLNQAAYDQAVSMKQEQVKQDLLNMFPDLEPDKLDQQIHATKYAYREIKTKIEEEDKDEIQQYITDNKTSHWLYLNPGSKRYYPHSDLAAQVLGFVNAQGGAVGIEAAYNDVLEGTEGRVVTSRNGRGTQMYNSYSEYIDAVNGYNVNLTIDSTIQEYCEETLAEGTTKFDVRNGAFCLVADPRTGAILAMASAPDFDPNSYAEITDPPLLLSMEEDAEQRYEIKKARNDREQNPDKQMTDAELREEADAEAYSEAVNTQWRSKVLDSRYEPGSTFKAMVLAAALEEGVVDESDYFNCTGQVTVPGYPEPIKCSNTDGHGMQSLTEAVENSCNPAFIEIGRRLGIDKFYDYFEGFGMTEKTGIELPGEASLTGAYWSREEMSNVDLAVASFGQRFEVTPLQMVAGFSAVVNGGYLMKPYIVKSITNDQGEIVQATSPTAVRQVVSEETSERAASILEEVVSEGTGNNAYVGGYRIGGKTGSAETREKGRTIVSFMGFAPADDPRVVVLLAYDKPQESATNETVSTTGVYISGGNMAAPMAGPLIARILDYMGAEKIYSSDEGAASSVRMPSVVSMPVADAATKLHDAGLSYRTVGEGATVSRQVPEARTMIPGDATAILYLGDATPEDTNIVPYVVGLSYENAKAALENAGFFMQASGVTTYYSASTTAVSQSVENGAEEEVGTVIEVQFSNVIEDGPPETVDYN